MDAVAHCTLLARYKAWATQRLLRAVDGLPEFEPIHHLRDPSTP